MTKEIFTDLGLFTGSVSGIFALVQGGRALLEKGRETALSNKERRKAEVLRLLADYEKNRDAFEIIFDYASAEDKHLRTDNLVFTVEEMNTRRATDRCFEHLRNVYMSWKMGIIQTEDLGPWTYWIHRCLHREPLRAFAGACGYLPFVEKMAKATEQMEDIQCLVQNCPWWRKDMGPSVPEQRFSDAQKEKEALRTPAAG